MTEKVSLTELRKETTRVTLEILHLCWERLQLARKIAEIKTRENIPIEDPKVEGELEKKVLQACQNYDIDKSFGVRLLELLLEESKRVQREILRPRS